jgi:glycosyltransferase involved in cell wall biosynthesis
MATSATSPRVLLITDNASLRMSGETSVPLYYFQLLQARSVDVWMVCHARVREELRDFFSEEVFKKIHFVEDTWQQRWALRLGHLFPYRVDDLIFGQLVHLFTQIAAQKRGRQLVKELQIDLVFEPTPITPKGLSLLYNMGVPVVIGPLCGGLELPPAFRYMDSRFAHGAIAAGRFFSHWIHQLFPGKLEAGALIVGNERTAKALPKGYKGQVYEVVESGVELSRWSPKPYSTPDPSQPVRFVFCGRLVDWKGAQFLVEAFKPVAERTNAILEIIGDGELKEAIAAKVVELGMQDHIKLLGRLSLEVCMETITAGDVYVMPSLRECGGLALLETMAIGLPIVAAKWAGPAEYLDSTCSILVEPSSPEGFVQGLAEAMIRLAESPELRHQLGQGAQVRVRSNYFDWESKTDRIVEILRETLERSHASQETTVRFGASPVSING